MSHLTKSKVSIKDLGALMRAAKKCGVQMQVASKGKTLTYSDSYIGSHNVKAMITYQGGKAGIREKAEGEFELIMDNYHNPLVGKVGQNCSGLSQQYTKEVIMDQVGIMGGMLSSEETLNDGSIEIVVTV